jgi:hypothetical protein
MMQIKFFVLNKWNESVEQFEKRVRDFLGYENKRRVTGLRVWEQVSNGEIIFQFELGEFDPGLQDFAVFAWLDLGTVEELINNTQDSLARQGKKATYLNVITLNKSPRALAAMLVEGSNANVSEPTGEEKTTEQDSGTHAESDQSAKRSQRRRNRKTSQDGAEGHG